MVVQEPTTNNVLLVFNFERSAKKYINVIPILKRLWNLYNLLTQFFLLNSFKILGKLIFVSLPDNFQCHNFSNMHMDKDITLKDIEETIKDLKSDKSQGVTGFTNEFYKEFSKDLNIWILNYIHYTYQERTLSYMQRRGAITLRESTRIAIQFLMVLSGFIQFSFWFFLVQFLILQFCFSFYICSSSSVRIIKI